MPLLHLIQAEALEEKVIQKNYLKDNLTLLAPNLVRKINGVYILWFKNSNNYILLDDINYSLLTLCISSLNELDFFNSISRSDLKIHEIPKSVYRELRQLLLDCNTPTNQIESKTKDVRFFQYTESAIYKINEKTFRINFYDNYVKQLIHPQFKHLQLDSPFLIEDFTFHISLDSEQLYLFTNKKFSGTFKKSSYHLLQGKFAIELLCALTNTHENDWLGTFHASTVSNNKEAIMLVGESGKGKSTLSALLMANGFNLVADDFTPVHAKSKCVYSYPSAISIKEGAFKVIKSHFKDFDMINTSKKSTSKGGIKYIAPTNMAKRSLPCNKIVLVNYKKNASTVLEEATIESVLKILIPDSWLSPIPENAEYFLNWLEEITFYRLTYSNTSEVVEAFNKLF